MSWLVHRFMLWRGWRFEGERPAEAKVVIVAAPHTSNWDFLVFLAVAHHFDIIPRFLGKDALFRGPLGWLMRRWGGIPVDRSKANDMVESVKRYFDDHDEVHLVITPEGTRGSARVWKSGFWRIADGLDVPVVMGFVDSATKTTGLGPVRRIDGDPHGWMDAARDFYADLGGIRPELKGPIVLASETD